MTQLDTLYGAEVVSELEFHQQKAIQHTAEADRHIAMGIEEYIAAGEHLIEVKARMEHGEFRVWVENEYRRSERQAQRYMQVARRKEELNPSGPTDLTLEAALRQLAPPKEKSEETETEQEEESPTLSETVSIITHDGEVISASNPQELAERVQGHLDNLTIEQANTDQLLEQIEKRKKEIEAERKKIAKELKKEREDLENRISKLDTQYGEALARVKAKYDEPDPPDFLEISDEAWAQAFAEAKSARVMEVAKRMNEIYAGWPRWMGEYLPGEAAAAIKDMDHAPALTEALRYVTDWLQRVIEEVEASEEERG